MCLVAELVASCMIIRLGLQWAGGLMWTISSRRCWGFICLRKTRLFLQGLQSDL